VNILDSTPSDIIIVGSMLLPLHSILPQHDWWLWNVLEVCVRIIVLSLTPSLAFLSACLGIMERTPLIAITSDAMVMCNLGLAAAAIFRLPNLAGFCISVDAAFVFMAFIFGKISVRSHQTSVGPDYAKERADRAFYCAFGATIPILLLCWFPLGPKLFGMVALTLGIAPTVISLFAYCVRKLKLVEG
jgi:hypothetical protein